VPFIATAIGTKVAIAAISLAVLGGGTAVAAAAGVLPTPAHTLVHHDSESPDPTASPSASPDPSESPDPSSSASAVEPAATGPAAFGLCTAYTAGGLSTHSVAYRALLAAATDGDVAGYCSTVLATHPGHSGDHGHGAPVPQHTGAPSGHSKGGNSGDEGSDGH
jgi:hypothetical protein